MKWSEIPVGAYVRYKEETPTINTSAMRRKDSEELISYGSDTFAKKYRAAQQLTLTADFELDGPDSTPAPACTAPLVIVESPYAGDVAKNTAYAREALRDCLRRGECPFASHLFYTQPGVLNDADAAERKQGMEAGFAWGAEADLVAVYDDLGISDGMLEGIRRARARGQRVEFRRLK